MENGLKIVRPWLCEWTWAEQIDEGVGELLDRKHYYAEKTTRGQYLSKRPD